METLNSKCQRTNFVPQTQGTFWTLLNFVTGQILVQVELISPKSVINIVHRNISPILLLLTENCETNHIAFGYKYYIRNMEVITWPQIVSSSETEHKNILYIHSLTWNFYFIWPLNIKCLLVF